MESNLLDLQDANASMVSLAGGKGANLGELGKIEGLRVPRGFCVTTEAFRSLIAGHTDIQMEIAALERARPGDHPSIARISAAIRSSIETAPLSEQLIAAITKKLADYSEGTAFAIRSSATAEDLPTASFAGQQDTFLNISGMGNILANIRKCWASLFTERAAVYRIQHGFGHRKVLLAVVVQEMIFPEVSGIMFTADPVSGNRKVVSIDAGFGLGEALVGGKVNPDVYKVRDGRILEKHIAAKQLGIFAVENGGTEERPIAPERQREQALTDDEIGELARTGKRIEAHFKAPQDIEWCLSDGKCYIVQSRPITTLYPVPEENDDANRVYLSTGHQQMMTDAMKPLGISFFMQTAGRPMATAGGRIFVDVMPELASPRRAFMLNLFGKSDPLMRDALQSLIDRGNFIPGPESEPLPAPGPGIQPPDYETLNTYDPAIVTALMESGNKAIAELAETISTKSGVELIDFIVEDSRRAKERRSAPDFFGVVMTGMNATHWINDHIKEWLGETNVADMLTQSVPNNITSEMGLALMDVADTIRPFPAIVGYLEKGRLDGFPDSLLQLEGGAGVHEALLAFLETYGMRCPGEIDITRPRWHEHPAALVPILLGNVRAFTHGAARQKFEQGRREAEDTERRLLQKLRTLPDGDRKAAETHRMIRLMRNLIGFREYPKYTIVSHYSLYKKALLKEAEKLVQAQVLAEKEDIFYCSLEEIRELIRTRRFDKQLLRKRKDDFIAYEKLMPPRVITSEGEVLTGNYRRENLPAGAIAGLPVSSGIIEGRARVVLDMEAAVLEPGDILVTTFTDPSWTPLFVAISGLVTEVGGLMTHGAVIAREYGLPAVVGVDNATRLIADGQRIRVNGTDGFIEML
ncbi:rifamycin-inactivating phosphotransferase [Chitinophaga rhizosphaerae]|uniref:rifamycin-inactivating phosphotransferase n=1 Tax=Chitinophaga rhizosphaerae TaxID=1864947 RepID=UPI000F80A5B6|nr:rifamycin-inactivating phosphotransferase [Chitinophaga rhizosphaerae]